MLLSIIAVAVIGAGLAATAFAQNSNTTAPTPTATDTTSTAAAPSAPFWNMGMMGEQGFGGGLRGPMGRGFGQCFGGYAGNLQLSSEYNQTVNAILNNDTDVQKLISQGYNITAIRPEISSVVGADGTITTKATAATVILQNGTSGFAKVNVDVTNAKVTHIVILTRTVIDKSTG